MPRKPNNHRIREYDENLKFFEVSRLINCCIAEYMGDEIKAKRCAAPITDFWREGHSPFAEAFNGAQVACRDVLEETHNLQIESLVHWDRLLQSQGAPTLSQMRLKHWDIVTKILKKASIDDDIEFYLLQNTANIEQLALSQEQKSQLAILVARYGSGD